MLVLPNRDVWTFEAVNDKVDLEDSVFLAGSDGPRRTAQIVIRQNPEGLAERPLELHPLICVSHRDQCPPRRQARAGIARCRIADPGVVPAEPKRFGKRQNRCEKCVDWRFCREENHATRRTTPIRTRTHLMADHPRALRAHSSPFPTNQA